MKPSIPLLILTPWLFLALPLSSAHAVWTSDITVDAPICNASGSQTTPLAVPDGTGGMIVAWLDPRPSGLYVQRLDANGVALWATDGVPIAVSGAYDIDVAADGSGGIFITWIDGGLAFVQRVDANGVPLWGPGGVRTCLTTGGHRYPNVESDGAGGAFVVWQDYRVGWTYRVFAQRLDPAGTRQWGNGALASVSTDWSIRPQACLAPSGDLVIAWHTTNLEVSCLSAANGSSVWPSIGVVAADSVGTSSYWKMVSDGTGGAIVAYLKNNHVYASRVDGTGTRVWAGDVPVSTVASAFPIELMEDGTGGAFVAWRDTRYGLSGVIAAQHLTSAGAPLWPANGVEVVNTWAAYTGHGICSDDAGGIIVEWHGNNGLRAQRVDASGAFLWPGTEGEVVSTQWLKYYDIDVISDGSGGAIAVYRSQPNLGHSSIHAERVHGDGTSGGAVSTPISPLSAEGAGNVSVFPNPFRGVATIEFAGRSTDGAVVDVLDVTGRRVRSLGMNVDGAGRRAEWDGRDAAGNQVPAGVYFVRDSQSGETGRIVHLR